MIPIAPEPADFYENTHVYERCHFCNRPTPMWHLKTNNPVCADCAKKHKVSELPDWTKKRKIHVKES